MEGSLYDVGSYRRLNPYPPNPFRSFFGGFRGRVSPGLRYSILDTGLAVGVSASVKKTTSRTKVHDIITTDVFIL